MQPRSVPAGLDGEDPLLLSSGIPYKSYKCLIQESLAQARIQLRERDLKRRQR